MGPTSNRTVASRNAAEEEEEARLLAARDTFPGWEILETFGGYLAVPKGAVIIQAISIDAIVKKLRQAADASVGE